MRAPTAPHRRLREPAGAVVVALVSAIALLVTACGDGTDPGAAAATPTSHDGATGLDAGSGPTVADRLRTPTDTGDIDELSRGSELPIGTAQDPLELVPIVLEVRPHDPAAFTQGLEFDGERLYESRGRRGESALTEIDPADGTVLRRVDLAPEVFAEGLTRVGDRLVQLTWEAGRAFVYDRKTLEPTGEFAYTGEGWGCATPARR